MFCYMVKHVIIVIKILNDFIFSFPKVHAVAILLVSQACVVLTTTHTQYTGKRDLPVVILVPLVLCNVAITYISGRAEIQFFSDTPYN